jgi:hypothetical protein
MSRFTPPTETPAQAPPADNAEARWFHLTTDLIFAAAYADEGRSGTSEFLRILDHTRRPYNRGEAVTKCMALCGHINEEGKALEFRLQRAYRADGDPTFRLRFSHLLPKRPTPIARWSGPRRPSATVEQHEEDADDAVSAGFGPI